MVRRSRFFLGALIALALVSHATRAHADEDPEMDRWRAFMPVFTPGAIAFLAGYAPSLIAAAPAAVRVGGAPFADPGDIGGLELAVPFAGPFIFADSHPRDASLNPNGMPFSTATKTLLMIDGAAQIGGAVLMLVGVAAGHRAGDEHVEKTARAPTFAVWPMVTYDSVGVGARIVGF
jgi:hypothetical protein